MQAARHHREAWQEWRQIVWNWARSIYTHEKYTEGDQYWSPDSEQYAAASQLISIMREGWILASASGQR